MLLRLRDGGAEGVRQVAGGRLTELQAAVRIADYLVCNAIIHKKKKDGKKLRVLNKNTGATAPAQNIMGDARSHRRFYLSGAGCPTGTT